VKTNERGFALALALVALVVIGALVAGAFFSGTEEQRIGEAERRSLQAFGVAEGGAYEALGAWLPESINLRSVYPRDSVRIRDTTAAAGTGSYGGWISRLTHTLYLVDVTGSDAASRTARQRVGVLVRVRPVDFPIAASLTTQGPLSLTGDALLDGFPHVPPSWSDCDTVSDTARAGLRIPDRGQVTGAADHTTGSPPVLGDTTVQDSVFRHFGDVTYDMLAAQADVVLPAGTYTPRPSQTGDGSCNTVDPLNWGDGREPDGACGNYFPTIHVTGAAGVTLLQAGQGQGILLVDGDLAVQGGHEYFGITVIGRRLQTPSAVPSAGRFWGAVLAENRDLEPLRLGGGVTVSYSKCAIVRSLQYHAGPAPLKSRGWIQLF
jgi:type IV pilus assembly PilX-like protein